jgi:hypothetical protein
VTLANAPVLVEVVIIVLNIAQLSYLTPIVGGIGLAQAVVVVAVLQQQAEVEVEVLLHRRVPVREGVVLYLVMRIQFLYHMFVITN